MHLFILTLFFIVVLISVGFAGLTCVLFLYEDTNVRGTQGFYEKHGAGPWRVFCRVFPKATLSQLLIFPTYFLGLLPWMRHPLKSKPQTAPGRAPVLLVHGLYHTPSAWLLFLWKLRKASWNSVFTFGYASWRTDLLTLREQLVQRIQCIAEESGGATQVVLIGHSLGGLLARSVAGDPRCRELLAAVVTLGAPHGGSKLAAIGFGNLARSLDGGSEAMRRLRALDAPPKAPCLSVYSPVDNMVLPNANLRLDLPGWQEEQTQPVSHVFMLYASDVHNRVLSFLEHVPFSSTNV